MARLIWTEPALADLDAIAEYIALDKPDAAKRYVQRIFSAVERLARFPNSGSIPSELRDLPYRQLVIAPCRIFYRFDGKAVFILHAMRSEQLFRYGLLEEREKKRSSETK